MDPEQLYQEVLQEEQQKGSSPPVAEGRAKAARQRAIEGSPHPKEPKWWPGAQPHLEGNGAVPAEEAAPAEEAPTEEAPAAAAEPAEAPAPEPAAAEAEPAEAPAPAEQPAAEAPAEPAAVEQPAAVATEAPPAPAAAPTLGPAYRPTIGTSPGLPSGNRLRPEDAVSTEAQFSGQKSMEQRRKLIDELVSTGVPAVTATEGGRQPSAWVSILFLVIPLVAILFLVTNEDLRDSAATGGEGTEEDGGGGGAPEGAVVAEGFAFEPSELTVSGEVAFENRDTVVHNIYIYPDDDAASSADPSQAVFQGEDVQGGGSTTYDLSGVDPGTYPFICQIHPNMTGTITLE